ncbi:MAG TPA: DUF2812 domain-containing protein [Acidobacteriota bacterium]|nr:DUF2812 domain-containing protein [Acidobacteriota bacterium]HQF88724.1 DUF2812 domain-containing protein [Acidobacteriota bacterium]HQG92986.1 DUF2812 domain-containing protein [Acidobacteriota bacterium]HQK86351.1 DUF2812 domain-containing protein [Acidobacteriota bacterium]
MAEIRRVFRLFWIWQDEQEAAWLTQMAAEGWHLRRLTIGCYTFERGEPAAVAYRLDYRRLTGAEREEYFGLFRDAGWERVATLANWHYFRKPAPEGPLPDIFSDAASRVDKYRRVLSVLVVILALNVIILATQRLPDAMTPAREIIRLLQAGAVVLLGWAVLRTVAHISRLKREARRD